jgi:LysM repeat protein
MLNKARVWFIVLVTILVVLGLVPLESVTAKPKYQQVITSPSQLIDAVNSLRIAYGLPPLTMHSILMQSAQSQADYMAATGQITHSRPGGVTFTQQLLALGFPLAGDLSLGGFRAENILMESNPIVWNGVPSAWQDEQHMNTMLSQNFTHIGAGISQGTNGYYYALDCAAVTGSGQMQDTTSSILTSVPSGAAQGISQYMVPVSLSTARPDGDVFHKVQYGQTLWSIAIEYGTTIKNIQTLNNLGEDSIILQGRELLVKKSATQPAPATSTALPVLTFTPTTIPTIGTPSISFPTQQIASPTATSIKEKPVTNTQSSKLLVGILIFAAFVGAGVAVWLIRDPN